MTLQAIQTHYNGYRFRSRLEARWAVFFDTAGIEYQYEPQGFTLCNGKQYLPDFFLPRYDCWVEVKGAIDRKAVETTLHAVLSGLSQVILLGDIPYVDDASGVPTHNGYYLVDSDNGPRGICHVSMSLDKDDRWGFDFGAPPIHFIYETGDFDCCSEKCYGRCDGMPIIDKYFTNDTLSYSLKNAYQKARQARFEHGERG